MQQTVDSNKTVLVDGPASVRLISGKAEVFGCQIKEFQRIVVREGKRVPFFTVEKAVFDVSLGPKASITEANGCSLPKSWSQSVETILDFQKRPLIIMIIGAADPDKNSLCIYLLNKLIDKKCRVAVLDGDLDQSDIGPSATISYSLTAKHATQLYDLKLKNAFFVGVTSPKKAIAKAIEGLVTMKAEILQQQVDFVLIMINRCSSGEFRGKYETALVSTLKPDIIVGIQAQDQPLDLITDMETSLIWVEPSSAFSLQSEEKRKTLREMTYSRYLKNAKLQCYPKSQVIIEPRKDLPRNQEPEKGLLVSLYGHGNKFLGIGVLREINQVRRTLKVQTAVSAKPSRIVIGKVFLNQKLQEVQE